MVTINDLIEKAFSEGYEYAYEEKFYSKAVKQGSNKKTKGRGTHGKTKPVEAASKAGPNPPEAPKPQPTTTTKPTSTGSTNNTNNGGGNGNSKTPKNDGFFRKAGKWMGENKWKTAGIGLGTAGAIYGGTKLYQHYKNKNQEQE